MESPFRYLLGKSLGNRIHHYLDIQVPEIDGKSICAVNVTEKSTEPVFMKDESGKEVFYIRRVASTIELHGSDILKYCNDHWK